MALICFCGAKFATRALLLSHTDQHGHRWKCDCTLLFKDRTTLHDHLVNTEHDGTRNCAEHPALVKLRQDPSIDVVPDNKCVVCARQFANADGVKAHSADKHPECPSCTQLFDTKDDLRGHQKSTGHCYCDQHDEAFRNLRSFKAHERAEAHVTGFECVDCDRHFGTQRALDHHLEACSGAPNSIAIIQEPSAAAVAAFAAVEEANLRCESCDKTFKSLHAQRQHKNSTKHKPLSELRCHLSSQCSQIFTSPSAYVLHLESGRCKLGMTRQKLNDLVHQYDAELHITYAGNASGSITDGGSVGLGSSGHRFSPTGVPASDLASALGRLSIALSRDSGTIFTPDDSDDASTVISGSGSIILTPQASNTNSTGSGTSSVILTPSATPSGSRSTPTGGVMVTRATTRRTASEWSFINDAQATAETPLSIDGSSVSTMTYDSARQVWPCNLCTKTFRKKKRLLQHLDSPVHAPKLFHCPPAAVLGLSSGKQPKTFKTLSGFAQHVESNACSGGKATLEKIVGIFENTVRSATGRDIKLLCDAS